MKFGGFNCSCLGGLKVTWKTAPLDLDWATYVFDFKVRLKNLGSVLVQPGVFDHEQGSIPEQGFRGPVPVRLAIPQIVTETEGGVILRQ